MFEALAISFDALVLSGGFIYLTLGTIVGLLFGVIPGLGGPTALALLIPLTFGIDTTSAMFLAGGIMGGVPFGGSITAILLNTPGTAPNAATVYDGYPMTKKGEAGAALGAAAAASSLGGLFGILILFMVLPVSRHIILAFSPPEFFMLAVLGLSAIAVSSQGKILKSLIAACVGLMIAFVGYDNVGGSVRFAYGVDYLWDGVPLIPALIGLFAIAQIVSLFLSGGSITSNPTAVRVTRVSDGVRAVFHHYPTLLRGSAIGALVGVVPGIGGTVAAFMSYSVTVQMSKEPETFGHGNIQGVIAPEAANNAREGGALIPTLAFGIPGSAEMAVFLGLLVLHGLQPGPSLILNHLDVITSLMLSIAIASVLASAMCLMVARRLALITLLDVNYLVPVILSVSLVGAYALKNSMADVITTAVFGGLGYIMLRFDYPRLPLVIALFLGEVVEVNFRQSMMIARDDWTIFFTRGLSLTLFMLIVFSLSIPLIRRLRNRAEAVGRKAEGTASDKAQGMTQGLRENLSDAILPIVVIVIAVIIFATSYSYDAASATIPRGVAALAIVFSLVELEARRDTAAGRFLRRVFSDDAGSQTPGLEGTAGERHPPLRELAAFGWIFAFLVLVTIFGFYIAIPIYVFSYLRFYGRKSTWISVAVAAGLTGFLFVMFRLLLGYEIFAGLIAGGIM